MIIRNENQKKKIEFDKLYRYQKMANANELNSWISSVARSTWVFVLALHSTKNECVAMKTHKDEYTEKCVVSEEHFCVYDISPLARNLTSNTNRSKNAHIRKQFDENMTTNRIKWTASPPKWKRNICDDPPPSTENVSKFAQFQTHLFTRIGILLCQMDGTLMVSLIFVKLRIMLQTNVVLFFHLSPIATHSSVQMLVFCFLRGNVLSHCMCARRID